MSIFSVWDTYSGHCMETSQYVFLCLVEPLVCQSHRVPREEQGSEHTQTAGWQSGERNRVELRAF